MSEFQTPHVDAEVWGLGVVFCFSVIQYPSTCEILGIIESERGGERERERERDRRIKPCTTAQDNRGGSSGVQGLGWVRTARPWQARKRATLR